MLFGFLTQVEAHNDCFCMFIPFFDDGLGLEFVARAAVGAASGQRGARAVLYEEYLSTRTAQYQLVYARS